MNILYYVCLLVTGYFDLHNIEPRLLPVLHMPYSQLVQPMASIKMLYTAHYGASIVYTRGCSNEHALPNP